MAFSFPKIMGILNVTPDSFSDGGQYSTFDKAVAHALEMIDDGADIIDVGGESTRPGSEPVPENEEISRVAPVIHEIRKLRPSTVISIDTTKTAVARAAVDEGAAIINDISGLQFDTGLARLAARNNLSLVIMHMQGTPRTMQKDPQYDDVVGDVFTWLADKIEIARAEGVKSVIADVGIGFGKTTEHNLELLRNHKKFKGLNVLLLLGFSRKRFIGTITGIEEAGERDVPTALLHALLLDSGADIIRVHNVKMIKLLKDLWQALFEINN